ncbi:MAG: hypothetical protein GF398_07240 [Chitinivibrionales bacterium]|nr:hypothetical protein [Chitinivibrionales bacterium]
MNPKVILLLTPLLLSNCYLVRQSITFLSYQRRAVPVEKLVNDTTVNDSIVSFLTLTDSIRTYAREALGLSLNKNFTTFIETDKRAIVTVVTACAADTFRQHTWWYPIVGSMPYKGFYRADDAFAEAEKLNREGLDVAVRPAGAFSTLGFFRDPLYSYMTRYSRYRLASMIIHEQVHATLFLKSRADFNEAMAVFIGDQAALGYIRRSHGESSGQFELAKRRHQDEQTYVDLLLGLYSELDSIYSLNIPTDSILNLKRNAITDFKGRYEAHYDSLFATQRYRGIAGRTINNAMLCELKTYHHDVSIFAKLYRHFHSDMPRMIEFLKSIPANEKQPYRIIESELQSKADGDADESLEGKLKGVPTKESK